MYEEFKLDVKFLHLLVGKSATEDDDGISGETVAAAASQLLPSAWDEHISILLSFRELRHEERKMRKNKTFCGDGGSAS